MRNRIIILTVLILLCGGFGFYMWNSNKGDKTEQPVEKNNGLKKYESNLYGFEYPSEYSIKEPTAAYKALTILDYKNNKLVEIYKTSEVATLGTPYFTFSTNNDATMIDYAGDGAYTVMLYYKESDEAGLAKLEKIVESIKVK